MSNSIDLKEIEQKTYLSYHQDGLADLAAGFFIGGFGLDMALKSSVFFLVAWLPIILVLPIRRLITYPRIGFVKFASARRRKISRGLLLLTIAGALSAILGGVAFLAVSGSLPGIKGWFDQYALLLLGALIASGLALIAFLFQISRFYAYAVIEFGAWLISHLFDIDPGLPVALAGALMILVGVGFLIRFLIENPRPTG